MSLMIELEQPRPKSLKVMVVESVLEEVNDLLVGDVDYGRTLVEEASHVLA
jgi:hypothetical protein